MSPYHDAPPAPSSQFQPPASGADTGEVAPAKPLQGMEVVGNAVIDPEKTYALPQLVDVAERTNPETRIAWERARAASIAVGLQESAYYPILTALAKGGKDVLDVGAAHADFLVDADLGGAAVTLQWLLFDFGGREAGVAAARQSLQAATYGFNAAHQKIIVEVADRFYALCAARGRVAVARSNLDSARAIADATSERLQNGNATSPDLLLAKQRSAQAKYDLLQAEADASLALADLADSMGIPPSFPLKVADLSSSPLPVKLEQTVEEATQQALTRRPDLLARLAEVRAADEELRKARAALLPTIGASAHAGRAYADAAIDPVPVSDTSARIDDYGAFLQIQWTLFDGFANTNKVKLAEARREGAAAEAALTRNHVEGDVFKAYVRLKTSLRKVEVAQSLVEASRASYDASLDSYKQGLRTVLDTLAAERDYAAARQTKVAARAELYSNWENLAFAMGNLHSVGGEPSK